MPLGFGEIAVLGVVGACLFIGPKRIIPRVAETMKMARESFAEAGKTSIQTSKKEAPEVIDKVKHTATSNTTKPNEKKE
eukprot:m.123385 g.123385  ORF g.123385 m.123385 type:complete len:79 (+) comp14445_c0_seq2:110-346(+)